MKNDYKILVIGSGVSGLAATLFLAEEGFHVHLLSSHLPQQSAASYDRSGLNGCESSKKEIQIHFEKSLEAADDLLDQSTLWQMCHEAPKLIRLLERMGVPFERSNEGDFATENDQGLKKIHAGLTTGRQILKTLESQALRYETLGKVTRLQNIQFVSAVLDQNPIVRGIIAQNIQNMSLEVIKADAVIFCTGGIRALFDTGNQISHGSPLTQLYRQGAEIANPEMIQFSPWGWQSSHKSHLFPERLVRRYAREHLDQPRFQILRQNKKSESDTEQLFYHIPLSDLNSSFSKEEMLFWREFQKLAGPQREGVIKTLPKVECVLGGLWVDEYHMTSLPGAFAVGEVAYAYQGAGLLEGNSLLSCLFGAKQVANGVSEYVGLLKRRCHQVDEAHFIREMDAQKKIFQYTLDLSGPENAYDLYQGVVELLQTSLSRKRENNNLKESLNQLVDFKERYHRIHVTDKKLWHNQEVIFAKQLLLMIDYASVMMTAALKRDESRGMHYKPEFPARNDEKFLKSTIAKWSQEGPQIEYEDVDQSVKRDENAKITTHQNQTPRIA